MTPDRTERVGVAAGPNGGGRRAIRSRVVSERVAGLNAAFMHMSARRWLHKLHEDIGVAGLAAAAAMPGLAAAVDQHAAAVRDNTTLGMESSAAVAGLVLLAAYARGLLEHAHQHESALPEPRRPGWAHADWLTVRLVAVCAVAKEHGKAALELPSLELPPRQA
jgi:hypothetical protein